MCRQGNAGGRAGAVVVVSFIIGVVVASALWQAGYPWWAIGAFLFIAGGLWLVVLKVLWTALTAPVMFLFSGSRRRDAREFWQAASQGGIVDGFTGDQLRTIFDAWRRARRTTGVSALAFLERGTSEDARDASDTIPYGRQKTTPTDERQRLERAHEAITRQTSRWLPDVPTTWPDGTPCPARQSFHEVTQLAMTAFNADDAEMLKLCYRLLASLAIAGREPVPASLAGDALEVRQRLARGGFSAEEQIVTRAGLIVKEYAERSGQGFVDDVSGTRELF